MRGGAVVMVTPDHEVLPWFADHLISDADSVTLPAPWDGLAVVDGEVACRVMSERVLVVDVRLVPEAGAITYRGCAIHGSGGLITRHDGLRYAALSLRARRREGANALLWVIHTARLDVGMSLQVDAIEALGLPGTELLALDEIIARRV